MLTSALLLYILVVVSLAAVFEPVFKPPDFLKVSATYLLQFLLPVLFLLAWFFLDRQSLPALLLPRLWGGIALGYLPLIFAGEVGYVINLFDTHFKSHHFPLSVVPWVVLWVLAIGVGFIYFFHEAHAACSDRRAASRRACRVLAWALLLDLFIGVWVCQLGVPVWQSAGSILDTFQVVLQAMARLLVPVWKADSTFAPVLYSHIALTAIPLPAFYTCAPLALLIGIIVQIIWEEKPITASVWLPEER